MFQKQTQRIMGISLFKSSEVLEKFLNYRFLLLSTSFINGFIVQ